MVQAGTPRSGIDGGEKRVVLPYFYAFFQQHQNGSQGFLAFDFFFSPLGGEKHFACETPGPVHSLQGGDYL